MKRGTLSVKFDFSSLTNFSLDCFWVLKPRITEYFYFAQMLHRKKSADFTQKHLLSICGNYTKMEDGWPYCTSYTSTS